MGLSRRQLFQLAGAVTLARNLGIPARPGALSDDISLTATRERAALSLQGEERWVVDTRQFGGKPHLVVEQLPRAIRLDLRDALYPGTDLSASLLLEATADDEDWTVSFTLGLGASTGRLPLRAWLAGDMPVVARVNLRHLAFQLDDRAALTLTGQAKAQIYPDWTLRLDGSGIAQLSGVGQDEIISDSVRIALLGADDTSMLSTPPARRTLVTLMRRDRVWPIDLADAAPPGWQMVQQDHAFDLIHIESGMNRQGGVRRAVVAEAATAQSRLALEAGAGLRGDGDHPFQLKLSSVRYAIAYHAQAPHTALVGRFSSEPAWLHAERCSLLLGDGPTSPGLRFVRRGERVMTATCSPALLGVSAPLRGAVVEPEFYAESTHLATMSFTPRPVFAAQAREQLNAVEQPVRLVPLPIEPIITLPLSFSISVVRPEDLLVLRFEFINLTLQVGGGQPARLVRQVKNRPAYVVVHFPPQAVGEQAFFETQTPGSPGDETPPAPPVGSRLSGPSRLAFLLPSSINEIPYSLESLLDWSQFDLSVVPAALPPTILVPIRTVRDHLTLSADLDDDCGCEPLTPAEINPPEIMSPQTAHTAIEAPYRVILSPNKYAGWAHAKSPVTHDGITELWHTRLGVLSPGRSVDELAPDYRTVRAIWTPDFRASAPPPGSGDTSPFRMSLTSAQRNQLVRLSSDYTINGYKPKPIQAERLMLSSLGAWLNVRGVWSPPGAFTVEEWRHRAVMGRDTYVRVVEKGYLFPFGNRASLITVTERKFQPAPSGAMAAYLRQRKFIVVRQPEKTYPATGQAFSGRQMPMKRVQITTLVTPNLDLPVPIVPGSGESSFWCRVGGQDFLFNIVTVDSDGQRQEFSMPMAFIKSDIAGDAAKMTVVANSLASGDVARRQRPLSGQKVAYAPSDKPGDTSLETVSLTFGAEVPDAATTVGSDQPRFFPRMEQAAVRLASVEQMTGKSAPAGIKLHQTYLQSGFDAAANKGTVFAELLSAVGLNFPADKSGGVSTPNMDIGGLSRALGPVGGAVNDIVTGDFDPKKFFSDEAKILGGILLSDILKALSLSPDKPNDVRVPQLTSRVVYPTVAGKEDKDAVPLGVETKLTWKPEVKSDPLKIFVANSNTKLSVVARLFVDFDGNPPRYEIKGELTDFKVDLLAPVTSFLILTFKQITFTAKDGEKPDVQPKIDKVEFVGPLKFVQTLQNFLKTGGGSTGFSLDVSPSGVKAGLTIAIPSVQLGVLAVANMALSIALNLPFSGDPVRLRFAFCERENPFLITVSAFGGGGFFAVALGLDGIEILEASFEFGGNLALNLGVASGGVYLMAGIYFKMEGESATLTGYLKCGGSLEVLGLITISAEFYMGLTYDIPNDKVWGQAILTVKIEILFFSISVDLKVERKFKGSAGDPTFADLMERNDWETYAEAFA